MYFSDTSSSECDCYMCQLGFEPSAGYIYNNQPFVYFAEVPEGCGRNTRPTKKPNCFVRAFRWYTEEHHVKPIANRQEMDASMNEFASWLDSKYEEFQRQNPCSVRLKSTVEACVPKQIEPMYALPALPPPAEEYPSESPLSGPPPQCCYKNSRFPSLKRPRKKGRDKSRSKERKCTEDRTSMEFILPPKDMSRAVSECFHPTVSSCCSVKKFVKSQSLTNVCGCRDDTQASKKETDTCGKPVKFDNPPAEKLNPPSVCPTRVITPPQKLKKQAKPKEVNYKSVSCQCRISVEKINAACQYDAQEVHAVDECCSQNELSCCSGSSVNTIQTKTKKKTKKATKIQKLQALKKPCETMCCQCPLEKQTTVEKVALDVCTQYELGDGKGFVCGGEEKNGICLDCHCPTCHGEENPNYREQKLYTTSATATELGIMLSQQNAVVTVSQETEAASCKEKPTTVIISPQTKEVASCVGRSPPAITSPQAREASSCMGRPAAMITSPQVREAASCMGRPASTITCPQTVEAASCMGRSPPVVISPQAGKVSSCAGKPTSIVMTNPQSYCKRRSPPVITSPKAREASSCRGKQIATANSSKKRSPPAGPYHISATIVPSQRTSVCQGTATPATKVIHIGAQTSDQAICLDPGTVAAVFMKIVCVNK